MYNLLEDIMQDKHILIVHHSEDRDKFINKINIPKTVIHVGNNPQVGDDVRDWRIGYQALFATWVLENYDNLPEYLILSQADPFDHVINPIAAMNSTFTASWGSFSYARALYNQWTTNWHKINPLREIAHYLGVGLTNDNNVSKSIYYFFPGEIFYVSKNKILEKPKSFYEKIILLDKKETYFQILRDSKKPEYFWQDVNYFHPELEGLTKKRKLEILEDFEWCSAKDMGYAGLSLEALWFYIWADKDIFDFVDTAQACIGNQLYFDTKNHLYDLDFHFTVKPFSNRSDFTVMNFRLFENNWFDWNCPFYLQWRESLIEQTIIEGKNRNFDGEKLLEFYKKIGYKHISF